MNAITIRCPTCNAALNVNGDATSVTCTYCHTPCRIQQRTRVFQLPRPVQGPPSMPVAKAPVRPAVPIVMGAAITMTIVGGLSGFLVMQQTDVPSSRFAATPTAERPAEAQEPPTPPQRPENLHWNSARPLLRDLDKDGSDDLIGAINTFGDATAVYLTAISGADGHTLWRSPAMPAGIGHNKRVAVAGQLALISGEDGVLHAYSLEDGAAAWKVQLGEKLETLCALPDPATIRLITSDEHSRVLQLADGKLTAPVPGAGSRRRRQASCDIIDDDRDHRYGQDLYDAFRRVPNVRGMSTRFMAKRGDTGIVAGGKSPGTSVPMLARLDKREVTWKLELPSSDHLTASFDEDILYFDDRVVLTTYAIASGGEVRLVALAPEDGSRKWEVPVQTQSGSIVLSSVFATQNRAVVVTWTFAMAFDLQTGKRLFKIGR